MAQDNEVLCGVALADAALILVKGQVEYPMDAIFDSPVATHGRAEGSSRQRAFQKAVARLAGAVGPHLPLGINGTNPPQAGPVVVVLQPLQRVWIGNHPGAPVLDA